MSNYDDFRLPEEVRNEIKEAFNQIPSAKLDLDTAAKDFHNIEGSSLASHSKRISLVSDMIVHLLSKYDIDPDYFVHGLEVSLAKLMLVSGANPSMVFHRIIIHMSEMIVSESNPELSLTLDELSEDSEGASAVLQKKKAKIQEVYDTLVRGDGLEAPVEDTLGDLPALSDDKQEDYLN